MSDYRSQREAIDALPAHARCRHGGYRYNEKTEGEMPTCREGLPIDDGASYCDKCDKYSSRYLSFPMQIEDIRMNQRVYDDRAFGSRCGGLVAVRPCSGDGEEKTYLGFFVGDLPTEIRCSLDEENHALEIGPSMHNPCMLIPALGRVVWGYESWWHRIESPDDLKDITDDDIDNVWYVQALKHMFPISEPSS